MAVESYLAPTSLPEALEFLRGGDVTVLAGGTDLMPQSHAGRVTIEHGLLNIRRVPELRSIVQDGDTVRIGACRGRPTSRHATAITSGYSMSEGKTSGAISALKSPPSTPPSESRR